LLTICLVGLQQLEDDGSGQHYAAPPPFAAQSQREGGRTELPEPRSTDTNQEEKEGGEEGVEGGDTGGGLKSKFDGVDLSGVTRILSLNVAEETKMKAVAKLFSTDARLLALLHAEQEGGLGVGQMHLWSAAAAVFTAAPNWEQLRAHVTRVEEARLQPSTSTTHQKSMRSTAHSAVGEGEGAAEGGLGGAGAGGVDLGSLTLSDVDKLLRLLRPLTTHQLSQHAAREGLGGEMQEDWSPVIGLWCGDLEELVCLIDAFHALLQVSRQYMCVAVVYAPCCVCVFIVCVGEFWLVGVANCYDCLSLVRARSLAPSLGPSFSFFWSLTRSVSLCTHAHMYGSRV
jgi:hypothetical protein